jgi:hypothetical protein
MPIEFRFDDLDLREEPQSGKSAELDASSACTGTDQCTVTCNTYTCNTSRNTCGTYYC